MPQPAGVTTQDEETAPDKQAYVAGYHLCSVPLYPRPHED